MLVEDEQLVQGTAFVVAVPGSDTFDTAASLGATFDVGQLGAGGLYFLADIFTWIENDGADFQPLRTIYTLEAGYGPRRGKGQYSLFVKHRSFQDLDSFDALDESYELCGGRYQLDGSPKWRIRAGKYINRADVGYDWDLAVSVTQDLDPIRGRSAYAHAWVHHVSEDGNIGRDGFTDYAVETGVRSYNGIIFFLRYELLRDVDRFGGESDHHLMVGTRYGW